MIIVLMGVTGSGKTTIGKLLAEHMGTTFADGDDFHSAANKAKMAAGHPLTDDDRQGWLETLNRLLRDWSTSTGAGVLACSALKQKYRLALGAGIPVDTLKFCLLDGSKELIAERLAHRHHEYMDPKLLDSQIATLERPSAGEAWQVENDRSPEEVVASILAEMPGAKAGASGAQVPAGTAAATAMDGGTRGKS